MDALVFDGVLVLGENLQTIGFNAFIAEQEWDYFKKVYSESSKLPSNCTFSWFRNDAAAYPQYLGVPKGYRNLYKITKY